MTPEEYILEREVAIELKNAWWNFESDSEAWVCYGTRGYLLIVQPVIEEDRWVSTTTFVFKVNKDGYLLLFKMKSSINP